MIVTRRFRFAAGHRLAGHEGKCANPHGHNYLAEVAVEGPLDPIGRVIDFARLKEAVGGWIEANWDHAFIFSRDDAALVAIYGGHPEWRGFVMDSAPTAENMAALLFFAAHDQLKQHGVKVRRVRLWETDDCYADAV